MASSLVSVVQQNDPGRFAAVKYRDRFGCIGVFTMILACYGGVVRRALATVEAMTDAVLLERCPPGLDLEIMREAREALIASYQASIASDYDGMPRPGQYTEAVTVDGEAVKGLRQHVDDPSRVYVAGLKVGFRLIEAGTERPTVKHRPLTIAKNAITRGLSVTKWRNLKGGEIVTLSADGERYEAVQEVIATI